MVRPLGNIITCWPVGEMPMVAPGMSAIFGTAAVVTETTSGAISAISGEALAVTVFTSWTILVTVVNEYRRRKFKG